MSKDLRVWLPTNDNKSIQCSIPFEHLPLAKGMLSGEIACANLSLSSCVVSGVKVPSVLRLPLSDRKFRRMLDSMVSADIMSSADLGKWRDGISPYKGEEIPSSSFLVMGELGAYVYVVLLNAVVVESVFVPFSYLLQTILDHEKEVANKFIQVWAPIEGENKSIWAELDVDALGALVDPGRCPRGNTVSLCASQVRVCDVIMSYCTHSRQDYKHIERSVSLPSDSKEVNYFLVGSPPNKGDGVEISTVLLTKIPDYNDAIPLLQIQFTSKSEGDVVFRYAMPFLKSWLRSAINTEIPVRSQKKVRSIEDLYVKEADIIDFFDAEEDKDLDDAVNMPIEAVDAALADMGMLGRVEELAASASRDIKSLIVDAELYENRLHNMSEAAVLAVSIIERRADSYNEDDMSKILRVIESGGVEKC